MKRQGRTSLTCIPIMGLLLGMCLGVSGQFPHHFRHFTEKDGLSDNRVQCILRDKSGFLWVGTANGLNRFDGHSFRHYLPDSRKPGATITNEGVNDLKQDSHGRIWIATNNGLNCLDPATGRFRDWSNTGRNDGSLPNSLVFNLMIDNHQRIWMACDNRDLTMFDMRLEKFTTYPWREFVQKTLPGTGPDDYLVIYYLEAKGKEDIWMATNKGLFAYSPTQNQFSHHPLPEKIPAALVRPSCPGSFAGGSWDKDVLHFDACTNTWSQTRLPAPEGSNGRQGHVSSVFSFGTVSWILAAKGLYMMEGNAGKPVKIEPALQNQFSAPTGPLTDATQEPEGAIWIGGEQGLWLCTPEDQHFTETALKPLLPTAIYNAFIRFLDLPASGHSLALDFYGHQLLVSRNGQPVKTIALPLWAALLHREADGTVWVGGGESIFQLDPTALSIKPFPVPVHLMDSSESSYFIDMAVDTKGRHWFANMNEGVVVWNPTDGSWWKPGTEQGFIGENLSSVHVDSRTGTVWIGSMDYGLFRYDAVKNHFTLYQHDPKNPVSSLGAYIVNDLCEDGAGYLWVATDPGGLSRFDAAAPVGAEFRTWGMEHGLPNGRCTGVIADKHGDIWATTLRGLVWIDHKTLRVRSFTKADGLPTDYLDLPPWLAPDGSIRVGTMSGYFSFLPDSLLRPRVDPRILVTGFSIFDRECADSLGVPTQSPITLSWQQNFFTLEFASADIQHARKQQFAYRLVGFDGDWVQAGKARSASYTNVPPGSYTLEVRSAFEGAWNPTGFSLSIVITPPFWQTWWFRITVTVLAALLAWAFYAWRIRLVRREADLKNEFNQRIARTEMSALRAQMNPHFVFNCLSSINRYILVNQPDEASAYLTKFARLIRLILDNSRTETVLLSKELEAIGLYVEMEQMRFNDRFDYLLDIAPDVQPEHLEVPPLLIQPFVENAIWHGLMHSKAQGQLRLLLYHEGRKLCVVVEDNGVGRQKAMELKSRSATVNKSHGMKVTSERIEAINRLYGTHATVETDDLTDAHGQPSGTRITLKF